MFSLRPRRSLYAVAAATLVLAASLTACSPAAQSTPSSAAPAGAGQAGTDQAFSAERDAYDLKLAQCLRGKGLDVKDPLPGKGIQENSIEINNAVPDCMDEIGQPPVSGGKLSDADLLAIWLKEADCFRKLGYQVDEPALNQAYTVPSDASEADVSKCISAMP